MIAENIPGGTLTVRGFGGVSMVRILSDGDIAALLDLEALLPVIEAAFVKQGRGAVERPERPHFPVGIGLDSDRPEEPLGTALTMPAYLHGADNFATKLVGVHEGNEARGLPTIHAQLVLTDATTGRPTAVMAATRITNARTGCIGGLAARDLVTGPITLGVIGAGTQARWQTRAIAASSDLDAVRIYSPSDSRVDCAEELSRELEAAVTPVGTPRAAVEGANVVVTATTATSPVFPGEALEPTCLVVAIGAYTGEKRELDTVTFDRANRVYADVPEEVAGIGDLLKTDLEAADLVPFSQVFTEEPRPGANEGIVIVESVGTAVLDAATAEHVYEAAVATEIGTDVTLD